LLLFWLFSLFRVLFFLERCPTRVDVSAGFCVGW
jgi:hypothetical protein